QIDAADGAGDLGRVSGRAPPGVEDADVVDEVLPPSERTRRIRWQVAGEDVIVDAGILERHLDRVARPHEGDDLVAEGAQVLAVTDALPSGAAESLSGLDVQDSHSRDLSMATARPRRRRARERPRQRRGAAVRGERTRGRGRPTADGRARTASTRATP